MVVFINELSAIRQETLYCQIRKLLRIIICLDSSLKHYSIFYQMKYIQIASMKKNVTIATQFATKIKQANEIT